MYHISPTMRVYNRSHHSLGDLKHNMLYPSTVFHVRKGEAQSSWSLQGECPERYGRIGRCALGLLEHVYLQHYSEDRGCQAKLWVKSLELHWQMRAQVLAQLACPQGLLR